MKKMKIAAVLMLIHGVFMEFLSGVGMLSLSVIQPELLTSSNRYFSFIVPYLDENIGMMLIAGIIFGIIRTIGAIGIWKNRMWGFVLAVINCTVTMALLIFMLPAGIMDGILAGTALILMLMTFFGKKEIVKITKESHHQPSVPCEVFPSPKIACGKPTNP